MKEIKSPVDKFYEWLAVEQADIEANGPKKRRGRKPTKNMYFTYITDRAIIAYNSETNYAIQSKSTCTHSPFVTSTKTFSLCLSPKPIT